jgi:hypothetical protein
LHVNKGKTIAQTLADRTDYAGNPEKTDDGELVTSYGCAAQTADTEFLLSKKEYEKQCAKRRDFGAHDILAFHVRQSFKPGEITPEEANAIGRELARRFSKGRNAFIVATHIDRVHVHNHIIINSTTLDCQRKFRYFLNAWRVVRRISDLLCVEHGLSIVENPKPSKGEDYAEWLGDGKRPSWQNLLRQKIEIVLPFCPTFEAFVEAMRAAGYEVNTGRKHITMKAPGQARATRLDTLRGEHTEKRIRERIAANRTISDGGSERRTPTRPTPTIPPPTAPKLSLLIDIQTKIQQGKGAGYEHWAKVVNLKEAAKTLMFLQDSGITTYEDLEQKSAAASASYREISDKIKAADTRQKEINELQRQIGIYSKTRDVYAQYRQSGYSKKFRAAHEADIILHQAAKQAFDALGLKKLPTIKTLQAEYRDLAEQKNSLYADYRKAKEDMRNLVTAKSNADRILRIPAPTRRRETEL